MGMIRTLYLRYLNRPDPAAVMQTPVVKYTGYDEAQQVEAQVRALKRARWRRKLEARRAFGRGGAA